MKKITSKEKLEKAEVRKKWLVGGLLIFLMFFSTLGYSLINSDLFAGNQEKENYENKNDYFRYELNGLEFNFLNSYEKVKNIEVSTNKSLEDYYESELFLDSKEEDIAFYIRANFNQVVTRIQDACYGKCEKNLPEKTCEDNLIIFEKSNYQRVYQEKNCIFIYGNSESVDAFFYRLLRLY